jgi:metallophosphoesterase (TIGR03767 family)
MPPVSRRNFLKLGGAAAAGAALAPKLAVARSTATGETTLAQTIVRGTALGHGTRRTYYRLAAGAGEPHLLRQELAKRGVHPHRTSLVHFAHFTDIHLIDAQSPARVEFLDRDSDLSCGSNVPFDAAYRPHETMTVHVLEAMIRRLNAIAVSPVTGARLAFTMCTGDNIDNKQLNETRWFIDTMDGKTVTPNSGAPSVYEGVMSHAWGDQEYWQPDPTSPANADKYKREYGYPDYPGLLEQSVMPFSARGIRTPWYQVFGNHDGLIQGNAPKNPVFNAIATGPLKVTGLPGIDPCDSFDIIQNHPTTFLAAPAHVVAADANRRFVSHASYIAEHFRSPRHPGPVGHGFTHENLANNTGYYVIDNADPRFRMIALDTLNPGGTDPGSVGDKQLAWLEARLTEVSSRHLDTNGNWVTTHNADRLVILFSHHGLRSLTAQVVTPSPDVEDDIDTSDLPRHVADDVMALVQRFPNVIAWVNGHTHNNIVTPRRTPIGGFWDIGTAAHVDWNTQSRLIEVIDNGDGTLSIMCTMFDIAAPIVPSGPPGVLRLASIARELSANDPQKGFTSSGPGKPEDRNVELVVKAPFPVAHAPVRASMLTIPRSGAGLAGALAIGGTAAIIRRRQDLLERRLES